MQPSIVCDAFIITILVDCGKQNRREIPKSASVGPAIARFRDVGNPGGNSYPLMDDTVEIQTRRQVFVGLPFRSVDR